MISQRGKRSGKPVDWRIWLGMALTAAYLLYGMHHILVDVGWSNFTTQPIENQGSFLEGAFAPLAFLWLVIGYFLQHKALQENNHNIELQYEEMKRAGAHAAQQAAALASSERHTRQASFLRLTELVNDQLGVTAGLLFLANQRPGQRISAEERSDLWTRVSEGDSGMFSRRLLELCYGGTGRRPDVGKIFYGGPARRRYTERFVTTFEALLEAARDNDASGLLVDAVVAGSAHGHLYRTIMEVTAGRTTLIEDGPGPARSAMDVLQEDAA
ncbi:MAG: hypothetical protein R3E86_03415 [Pseudomonadales bacterium]